MLNIYDCIQVYVFTTNHHLNSTSRYLDDLLSIDNIYFEGMVGRIYPPELQLDKANASDTKASFFYLFQTDLFHPKFMTSAEL